LLVNETYLKTNDNVQETNFTDKKQGCILFTIQCPFMTHNLQITTNKNNYCKDIKNFSLITKRLAEKSEEN